jgi:hypothetical protein
VREDEQGDGREEPQEGVVCGRGVEWKRQYAQRIVCKDG